MEHFRRDILLGSPYLAKHNIIIGSALSVRNIHKTIDYAKQLYAIHTKKIKTSQLNKFMERTIQRKHPPMVKGKRLRIYYMIQKRTAPQTFTLFINHKHLVHNNWMRYLENQLVSEFELTGVPIRIDIVDKSDAAQVSSSNL